MRLSSHRTALPAALLLVPVLMDSVARADVDVEIRAGDKILATMAPADEVETFRVTVPAKTVISVVASAKRIRGQRQRAGLDLKVLDDVGTDLADTLVRGRTTRRTVRVTAPATGEYRVQVLGAGVTEGDYTLRVVTRVPGRQPFKVEPLAGGGGMVEFGAVDGARATFSVKAARRSPALPRLASVSLGQTEVIDGFTAPRRDTARAHVARGQTIRGTGTFTLFLSNAGEAGDVAGRVTVKVPRRRPDLVDLTGANLDAGGGDDQVARGRIIGDEGGGIAVTLEDSAEIGGSGVDIPAGALATPTAIVVATSTPIEDDEDRESSGPTVFFGPAGTEFLEAATITIPFDGVDSPDLTVVQKKADGTEVVIPYEQLDVDEGSGTLSFPVLGFSSFGAFRPAVPVPTDPIHGDLNGDGNADLVVRAPAAAGGAGVVYLYFGPLSTDQTTSGASSTITGVMSVDGIGEAILAADLDGDGTDELIISGNNANGGDGELYIFSGLLPSQTYGADDATAILTGLPTSGEDFGIAFAVGDMNGDLTPDLLVGAENGGVGSAGKAYLFLGNPITTFPFASANASAATVTFPGDFAGDRFGSAVAVADVTGDGADDVIIAADQVDTASDPGMVYIFVGPMTGAVPTLTTSAAAGVISGDSTGDGFGLPLTTGDVDDDGTPDLIVAAPPADRATPSPQTDVGAVYVFFGGSGITSITSASSADLIFQGVSDFDNFGVGLACGDVSGDGIDDVVVGSPGDDFVPTDSGAVFIFEGAPVRANVGLGSTVVHGEVAGDVLGFVDRPVDVDGNGRTDLIVVAPENGRGGTSAGTYYIVFGRTGIPFDSPISTEADDSQSKGFMVVGAAGEHLGVEAPE